MKMIVSIKYPIDLFEGDTTTVIGFPIDGAASPEKVFKDHKDLAAFGRVIAVAEVDQSTIRSLKEDPISVGLSFVPFSAKVHLSQVQKIYRATFLGRLKVFYS